MAPAPLPYQSRKGPARIHRSALGSVVSTAVERWYERGMLRLALFDFDGTLADSFSYFASTLEEAAPHFGFRAPSREELDSLRELDAKEILRALHVPIWKVPAIATFMRQRMSSDRETIRVFPGVRPTLRRLREKGMALGIVSSNAAPTIRAVLGEETASLVAHYECGISLFGKPARLKRVLRRSGMEPEETIYIGDELRDLYAARAAGMRFGAVTWGYNRPEALEARNPDAIFHQVEELAESLPGT